MPQVLIHLGNRNLSITLSFILKQMQWHVQLYPLNDVCTWDFFFFYELCTFYFSFLIGPVSSTTHYIHYKDTFLMQNFHSIHNSLSQELAPSKDSSASAVWSIFKKTKQMQPLFVLWMSICATSVNKQATLHFFLFQNISLKARPGNSHCFFEGSAQLHVPKSAWLPGRPFWSVVSEQLRWSSFGIYCKWPSCTEAHVLCAKLKMLRKKYFQELSLLYYLYIKGKRTSVRIGENRGLRLRHQTGSETKSMVTREALIGPEDKEELWQKKLFGKCLLKPAFFCCDIQIKPLLKISL